MNKKELYDNYLSKIEESLLTNNLESINYILEFIYTSGIPEKDVEIMDDILQEVTLYAELGEIEYKNQALCLINKFNV